MKKIAYAIILAATTRLALGALVIEVDDGHCGPDKQGKSCFSFGVEMNPEADVTLGRWHLNLDKCKALADEKHIPMIAIWSNTGCSHCQSVMNALMSDTFVSWRTGEGSMPPMILVFMEGGEKGNVYTDSKGKKHNHEDGPEYNWCWGPGKKTGLYPFVAFYWNKGDGKSPKTLFTHGEDLTRTYKADKGANYFIARAEEFFAGWSGVEDPYSGGTFADPDSEGDRLEFESGTESVNVNLSRTATVATNVTLLVMGPTGTQLKSETIDWAADETNKTVEVALTSEMKSTCAEDGQQLMLCLSDGGKDMSTNHITFVKRAASAANPKWLNEKFDFGEWTMDFDAATGKVAQASGDAYTLVSIQGSKWCHDCANTDRNFLEVVDDESGKNKFKAWAESKQIALVSMDIPNYSDGGSTPETVASPTLFSKKAFKTQLAFEGVSGFYDVSKGGADPSLTNAIERSGLGYLTRKGATDEQAAAVMEKFHKLAVTNTDKGGFHRPEDSNKYRTGVPIFVLLRKDGTVAARFTRFASASPMAADQANFDNYIKRFEEMLAIAARSGDHVDASEVENNYPGAGAISFAANGGQASGEICNADFQDAFKLAGVGGNALQKVTVSGTSEAEVTVSYLKLGSDGKATEIAAKSGKLSSGIDLDYTFTEVGDYYALVKGKDITSSAFAAAGETENQFHSFTIRGDVVLVPQEMRAEGAAPAGSNTVKLRLTKDKLYRFEGLNATENITKGFIERISDFGLVFKALVSDDVDFVLETAGGTLKYQIWTPSEIGFAAVSRTVSESSATNRVTIKRTGGKSGKITASVKLNVDETDYRDWDGETPRYEFVNTNLVWEEGDTSDKFVNIILFDDIYFVGDGKVVLDVAVEEDENGDTAISEGKGKFTLNVTEDERSKPGRAMISGAEPFFASKTTVYAKQTKGAVIKMKRIEHFDGMVAVQVKAADKSVKLVGGDDFWPLAKEAGPEYGYYGWQYWANRDDSAKSVVVTNLPAPGKSVRVLISKIADKEYLGYDFPVMSASNAVTVVSVADEALEFADEKSAVSVYRYTVCSNTFALASAPSNPKKVAFTKVSGTLPSGLKVGYDSLANAMAIYGSTTAKSGVYPVVYRVKEGSIAGLVTAITITVVDPTDAKNHPETANVSVATSRTLKNIAVLDGSSGFTRLVGTLQMTIPTKGNVSAKLSCEFGTISFSSKGWGGFDPDPESRTLECFLTSSKKGWTMNVAVRNDYSVDIEINNAELGLSYSATSDGKPWSKVDNAKAWGGYYTVAMPSELVEEITPNLAPRGSGYLTLKMMTNSTSAVNSGTFTWAGMLPNGTALSGTAVLMRGADWARLPLYKKSSTDIFAAVPRIRADDVSASDCRRVQDDLEIRSYCEHFERATDAADYFLNLHTRGALYDKAMNLCSCCSDYTKDETPDIVFDTASLVNTSFGVPDNVATAKVVIAKSGISLKPSDPTPPAGLTLSFNRSTGVASGRVRIPVEKGYISATWKGVLVDGWGNVCGCAPDPSEILPFVNGSYWFSDKVEDSGKLFSVKRGGLVAIAPVEE